METNRDNLAAALRAASTEEEVRGALAALALSIDRAQLPAVRRVLIELLFEQRQHGDEGAEL